LRAIDLWEWKFHSVCSTSQQEPMAMRRHCASPGAALLLRHTAVLPAIG
jgi:hypothetical protein